MEFVVLSRKLFEEEQSQTVPHILISINCPDEAPAKFAENEFTLGRINHFFWDLDVVPNHIDDPNDCKLIEKEDAVTIVALVKKHLQQAQKIIVHCTAGKSRSAAVAASLMKCITGDDNFIFKNPKYKPNMRVYRMIIEAWYEQPERT